MNISSSRDGSGVAHQIEGLESRLLLATTPIPGSLDITFGDHGSLTFSQLRPIDVQTIASAALPDGKTLLVGSALANGTSYASFELARFNADGSPDATFGINGVRVVPNSLNMRRPTPDALYDFVIPQALAVDRRGRIYVGGFSNVARLKPDGSPDRGFGSFGTLTTPVSVNALMLAPNGDIVVGGNEIPGGSLSTDHHFGIARIHKNGTIDKSFGDHGVAVADFRGRVHLRNSTVYALALDVQGRILAAGGDDGAFDLARFNANGSLDRTFGFAGKFALAADVGSNPATSAPTDDGPYFAALAVRASDGEIFAGGGAPRSTSQTPVGGPLVLAALRSTGQLDRDFAHRGLIKTGYGVDADKSPRQLQINGIALLPSGKLVVAGTFASGNLNSQTQGLLLARFDADGAADPSFAQSLPLAAGTDPALAVRFLSTGGGGNLSFDSFTAPICAGLITARDGTFIIGINGLIGTLYNRLACLRLHPNGSRDRSFARHGLAVAPFLSPDESNPVKLVTGPATGAAYLTVAHARDASISSVTVNGLVDPSFHVRRALGVTYPRPEISVVAVQPDGKVLLQDPQAAGAVALVRRNPDGSIDASFGTGGYVFFPATDPASVSSINKAMLRADGSIVIDVFEENSKIFVGTADTIHVLSAAGQSVASRRLPQFTFDTTTSLYCDMALAPDGKILLDIQRLFFVGRDGVEVWRLNADDLTPDLTFGSDGISSLAFQPFLSAGAIAVLADGHVLVVAQKPGSDSKFLPIVARLDGAGKLDPTFAHSGILQMPTAIYGQNPDPLLIQHDGRFLVVIHDSRRVAWLARFNPDGTPDLTFGRSGSVPLPRNSSLFALTSSPSGEKLLIASSLRPRHFSDFDTEKSASATQLLRFNL